MGDAPAPAGLSGLVVVERDDGLFAVRGPVGTRRFVIEPVEKALLDELCAGAEPPEALARYHARGRPPAFHEMLHLQEKLREAGLLDRRPPRPRAGLTWQHPMPAPWLLVVTALSLVSLVVGVGDVIAHESTLFAVPHHLARQFVAALAAVAMASSLAAVLRAGLYASRGLGPQRLFVSLAGCVPHVTVDDSEALGLGAWERRLVLLASALAPGIAVGIFAACGQHDAAFFAGAAWFAALQPLRGGPLATLLSDILHHDDVLEHARHFHKRLLGRSEAAESEMALVTSLSVILLWVGGLLWIVARVADRWPAVSDFSPDTGEGVANLGLSLALMALAATITLSTLAFLVRLLVESLGPISPSRPRPRTVAAGDAVETVRSMARSAAILRTLSEAEFDHLLKQCPLARYAPGSLMERRGRPPEHVQVIVDGEATVIKEHDWGLHEPTHALLPGDFTGEAALVEGAPAADTVRARLATRVILVPPEPLRAILAEGGRLEDARSTLRLAQQLRHNALLRSAAPRSLHDMASAGVPQTIPAGTAIVREGEGGDTFYVIEAGRVDVTIGGGSVKILGAGDFFGEVALLADIPRMATVTALEDCRLRALSREAFWTVLSRDPQLGVLVEAAAARRYQP